MTPHNAFSVFAGLKIVESEYLTEVRQVKFPKSKKKRIREKFRRKSENWASAPMDHAFVTGDTVMMHPVMAARFRAAMAER